MKYAIFFKLLSKKFKIAIVILIVFLGFFNGLSSQTQNTITCTIAPNSSSTYFDLCNSDHSDIIYNQNNDMYSMNFDIKTNAGTGDHSKIFWLDIFYLRDNFSHKFVRIENDQTFSEYNHSIIAKNSSNIQNKSQLYPYVSFTWEDIPADAFHFNNGQYQLQIYYFGYWDRDDGGNVLIEGNKFVTVNQPSDLNTLAANNQHCGEIELSWAVGNFSNDVNSQRKTMIERKIEGGSYTTLDFVTHNVFSYTDASASLIQDTSYTYRLRHVYYNDSNYIASNPDSITVQLKGKPTIVQGFQATQDRCDNKIELTWQSEVAIDKYRISRDGTPIKYVFNGSGSYLDDTSSLVRGVEYTYQVEAYQDLCNWSNASTNIGVSPASPEGSTNVWLDTIPGDGLRISFDIDPLADSYKIERNLLGGGGASFFTLPTDSFSYLDQSITACQTYEYRVLSINECALQGIAFDTVVSGALIPNFDTVFDSQSLDASKGYYPNRVELQWTLNNNENFVNAFKIYRKVLGSGSDSILIASQNSGSNLYQDFLIDAGVLYEYFIVAEAQCEQSTLFSNVASTVGFRSVTGTIAGQVYYVGGIAVKDVKIEADNSSGGAIGKSISFSAIGNDSLVVLDNNNFDLSNALTSEFWFKPRNQNDYTLVEKKDVFSIKHLNNDFVFEVFTSSGTSQSISMSNVNVNLNNYHQFSATVYNDTMRLYLNGVSNSYVLFGGDSINQNSNNLVYGKNFNGLLDEVRLWNIGKSKELIQRDYKRQLNGAGVNLKVYLKFNENVGNYAYDFSRENNSSFNKNHGQLFGNIIWSDVIPTQEELSLASYTDSLGNYFLSVPYTGIGETFVITPIFFPHGFSPSTTALFIGDGSTIHNNINFEDNSSFQTSGTVKYSNSNCFVEGAFVRVDGDIQVGLDNLPITTDSEGKFNIQVPIGPHFVSVEKSGHTFEVARFPEIESLFHDFQIDGTNLEFKDSTRIKVVGRVVGGLREANKFPGVGRSKNNIGVAKVTFTTQNNCEALSVFTDTLTGEYTAYVLPVNHVMNVNIPSNPGLDAFDNLDLVEFTSIPPMQFLTDSVVVDTVFVIDSVSYQKRLDYIYRSNPEIAVFAQDSLGTSLVPFKGEDEIEVIDYTNNNNPSFTHPVDSFPYHVFTQIHENQEDFKYRAYILTYEPYTNSDGILILDSVPVMDGELLVENELADAPLTSILLSDVVTDINQLTYAVHEFIPGTPSFIANTTVPEYSYTKKLYIAVQTSSGLVIPWKPGIHPITGVPDFYRAYLLGSKINGNGFFTNGPETVDYVLRDPPGGGSYATRLIGEKISSKESWGWSLGVENENVDKVNLGVKMNIGLGVSTETEISNNTSIGTKMTISGGKSGSVEKIIENTSEWSTNSNPTNIGSLSDLYIGKSSNVEFGITEHLKIVPDYMSSSVDSLRTVGDDYSIAKTYSMAIAPLGYNTGFIYSQYTIENELIPTLKQIRKILLQGSKYESHLNDTVENYGKNNDNPVFGADVSSLDPLITYIPADYSGESYTYTPTTDPVLLLDSASLVDSVRLINQQIRLWETAIYQNEFEKVNIDNEMVLDSLKNYELTKLDDRYLEVKIAYLALELATAGLDLTSMYVTGVAPAPGAAIVNSVLFLATTGTSIGALELKSQYDTYIAKRESIEAKFMNLEATNHSISGGATYTAAKNSNFIVSSSESIEFDYSVALNAELEAKVSNVGVGTTKGLTFSFNKSTAEDHLNESNAFVSYTLTDQNIDDFSSVDVFSSMYGWGPIFKRKTGGETACPYEPAEFTSYYKPGTQIAGATIQRDVPKILVDQPIITNVPVDQAAVFVLTLENLTETGSDAEFTVKSITSHNPYGAIISINGGSSQTTIVPFQSSINLTLAIEKGPGGTYEYNNLLIVAQSACQSDIVDSVWVSAHFLPTCTDIELFNPQDNWILNNSYNDTLPIAVGGYDVNFFDLDRFRIEYKPNNAPEWIGLESYWKDSINLTDPTVLLIPDDASYTNYFWYVDQIDDGEYDLRATSYCSSDVTVSSLIYSGRKDTKDPHTFGTPVPGDGILGPNEDISIKFNEPVDFGSLSPSNFDVRGVLNQTNLSHHTSLYFDGVDDEVKIDAGANIQNRDFTIEFWAKRDTLGEQVVISQGSAPIENLSIGFNAVNKIIFKIGNEEVVSDTSVTDNNWHHYAIAYDFDLEQVKIYFDAALANTGNITFHSDFVANESMYFGKNASTNSNYFSGNLHEIRFWNKLRTGTEISVTVNLSLSRSALGLLYNWKVDEATGLLVKDHIRRIDGIIDGASWQITPNGHAMDLGSSDGYLIVENAGNVAITKDMDFTLEFWYNSSTNTNVETMFSNGLGTGVLADSLTSWNIEKDALGQIHVKHYGIDFIAVADNTFDGSWHHFALILHRNGSLSSYSDGELQNSLQALEIQDFGGSTIFLGARGEYNSGALNVDQHFNGLIDEFRFWNTARKVEQLQRDKQNKLIGDELGLLSYIPMEEYQLSAGFPTLNASVIDVVDSTHIVSQMNGANYTVNTPTIKLQRPIQSIAHDYSVNNDEIIITPSVSQELIENITLDITVSGVKDLSGNDMQSPETWIAYFDKNQVIWQDVVLSYNKPFGEELVFSSAIINNGGSAKIYEITNLPEWLTASQTTGSIAPNSVQEIEFTIDPNVNIGDYTEDIHLTTDFGFPEKLSLDLKVRASEPAWTVNPSDFNYSMSIIGVLKIENVFSTDEEDVLGVFVNNEPRGAVNLEYLPALDRYIAFLDVYSNVSSGEELKFKIWDASKGISYVDIVPDTLFTANDIIGTLLIPQEFSTGDGIIQEIEVVEGWNWISFNLLNVDSMNVDATVNSYTPDNADELKGQTEFANYSAIGGWTGTIESVGIRPENGYRLKALEYGTLELRGSIIDPTSRTINLDQGWSWIGFISIRNQSIDQALGNLTPANGDLIKGKSQFAVYDYSFGWVGTLNALIPGQSYMYKSANANSFTFPIAGAFKSGSLINATIKDKRWVVNANKYGANMSQIVALDFCKLSNNNSLNLEHWYIGVFDEVDHCRSLNKLVEVEGNQIAFVSVPGDSKEKLEYRLLNRITNEETPSLNLVEFESNRIDGEVSSPYLIQFSEENCKKIFDENNVTIVNEHFNLYPNIFENNINVSYYSIEASRITINICNNMGQNVFSKDYEVIEGQNHILIEDLKRKYQLNKGVYYFELLDNKVSKNTAKIIQK